nr:RNA-directed DNA polymerase, eukaryota, reverse transcriptase zinc-binding domain protein [Tanacetum cinerariifolium]
MILLHIGGDDSMEEDVLETGQIDSKFSTIFGDKWCGWIQSRLRSSRGPVIVNESLTHEFQSHGGLKQGDLFSPFLFILIMEILHISVQRVVDAGMFRGISMGSSLWVRVIKGIHDEDGKLGKNVNHSHPSIWLDIVREMKQLKNHNTNLIGFIHKKMGNGADTSFWEDVWRGDCAFKSLYHIIYALETCKNVTVAVKMSHENVRYSLSRIPRGGIEQVQFPEFLACMEGVALVGTRDRWVWSLEGS